MYITLDKLDNRPPCCEPAPTSPSTPPLLLSNRDHCDIMADPMSHASLGKRKREATTDGYSRFGDYDKPLTSTQTSPSSKASRWYHAVSHVCPETNNNGRLYFEAAKPLPAYNVRPTKHLRRSPPTKITANLRKIPSHLMDTDVPTIHDIQKPPPRISESDLSACHICHSAPKRKSDLENYLQCQVCSERACYICARECYGECKKQVCSKCCVQVGEDWDTYCLSCYERDIRAG
jgi:hypothetical protein